VLKFGVAEGESGNEGLTIEDDFMKVIPTELPTVFSVVPVVNGVAGKVLRIIELNETQDPTCIQWKPVV